MRLHWAAALVAGCAVVGAAIWVPQIRAWQAEPSTPAFDVSEARPDPKSDPKQMVQTPAPANQAPANQAPANQAAANQAASGPVLALPGELPATGSGTFVGATEGGPLLGNATARRFKRVRVAVESELVAELEELSAAVDATLGDSRSWIAGGAYRFQRVPYSAAHDFTVYLVTRETAYKMCRVNGVDIRVDGVPYTSCRQVGKVVINLDRWRLSVPSYVDNRIPLSLYRSYVINHEVGHELGHGHVGCPVPGGPAPVMLTQTLGLQGCTVNPWPHPDGA